MKTETTNQIIAQNLLALLNANVNAGEWNRLLEMIEQIQSDARNQALTDNRIRTSHRRDA